MRKKTPIPISNKSALFELTLVQNTAIERFKTLAKEFFLVGGSRSGKTFIIIYQQIQMALANAGSRHLIARFRFNHVKNSVWRDTLRKVLKLCYPDASVTWRNTDYYIEFGNGSQIWLAGLDEKDRTEKILGMEFLTVFLNEASQIPYNTYTTIKTRLAQQMENARPLLFIDANPPSKKHWLYKIFVGYTEPETNTTLNQNRYSMLRMNPDQNLANISSDYLDTLDSLPLRKRLRFRDGEFADDTDGALWTDDLINGLRLQRLPDGTLPVSMKRIVVAVDPAVTSKDTSDETGIIVAGIGFDNHLYVLEDKSGKYSSNEWAAQAIVLYEKFQADRLIGETNNGGDLVETVIRGRKETTISYKGVRATRDKFTRAEPVAALYEQGKAHHIGQFLALEIEMTSWDSKKGSKSPNRIDALVWAATELCLTKEDKITGKATFHFADKDADKIPLGKKRLLTK